LTGIGVEIGTSSGSAATDVSDGSLVPGAWRRRELDPVEAEFAAVAVFTVVAEAALFVGAAALTVGLAVGVENSGAFDEATIDVRGDPSCVMVDDFVGCGREAVKTGAASETVAVEPTCGWGMRFGCGGCGNDGSFAT
jgi:hypothetical protein